MHLVVTQAQALRHGTCRACVVARDHDQAQTACPQRRQGGLHTRLGFVAEGQQGAWQQLRRVARTHPLDQHRDGGPLGLQGLRLGLPGCGLAGCACQVQSGHPAQTSQQQGAPLHLAFAAITRHGTHGVWGSQHQALGLGGLHHGTGQRVLAAGLNASGHGQPRVGALKRVSNGRDRQQPWLAHRQRPCFVKGHRVHTMRHF